MPPPPELGTALWQACTFKHGSSAWVYICRHAVALKSESVLQFSSKVCHELVLAVLVQLFLSIQLDICLHMALFQNLDRSINQPVPTTHVGKYCSYMRPVKWAQDSHAGYVWHSMFKLSLSCTCRAHMHVEARAMIKQVASQQMWTPLQPAPLTLQSATLT